MNNIINVFRFLGLKLGGLCIFNKFDSIARVGVDDNWEIWT